MLSRQRAGLAEGRVQRDERWPILVAVISAAVLASLDTTVVTTAIPSIVRSFGAFSLFPWLFSIYLLAQVVSVPIYGRLADIYGRRPVLIVSIGIFLVGSMCCGFSQSMIMLIIFRGIQGIGAGGLVPVMYTVVGDMYSVEERPRVQGYISGSFFVASALGPLVGGLLTQYASWRWIFYVNVPIGLWAIAMIARRLPEKVIESRPRIDWLGGFLLASGSAVLMLALLQGGTVWQWRSAPELACLAVGLALVASFVAVENVVEEPMISLPLVLSRPMAASLAANAALGGVMIGVTSYLPTFVQGVLHKGPLIAGLVVASISLGWPISSANSGKIYLRFGFRTAAVTGAGVSLFGTIMLATMGAEESVFLAALFAFVIGLGLGCIATPVLVAMQNLVSWSQRGAVTGVITFGRSVGSMLGVATFGSIANAQLQSWLNHAPSRVSGSLPHTIDAASRVLGSRSSGLTASSTSYVRQGLYQSTHLVFLALLVLAAACMLSILCLPTKRAAVALEASGET
jgi:EmrB/QacA subfamily drug resistance transporter